MHGSVKNRQRVWLQTGRSRPAPRLRRRMASRAVIGLGLLLGLWTDRGDAAKPPESHRMQPDHAPTPFSAEQIRDGCPSGAWRSYRLSVLGPQGWRVTHHETRFVRSDEQGTDIQVTDTDTDGQSLGEPQQTQAQWEDLQAHASFPQAETRIEEVPVTLDCGAFDTWLYEVVTFDGGHQKEKRLWFAHHLPGPPVFMEEWLDGELVFRMTLVDYGPRPETASP